MAPYFMIIIFAITGIIALLAALFNWGWFFTAQNAQYVVKILVENIIFYIKELAI